MDTRFWGPSGWKMLHLISFNYQYSIKKSIEYGNFFESLPFILPCKFCRTSLTEYYKKYPFQEDNKVEFKKGLDMKRWLYNIHNCVNDKLRKQGLNPNSDPKFNDVKKFYEKWKVCDWKQQMTIFWDFLFAVAYNHPKESSKNSTPMPNCPPDIYKCNDICEKNKWNILTVYERMKWFKQFWSYLPVVFPEEIAKKWNDVEKKNPPILECRRSTLAWLWRMRCGLDSDFKDPYTSVCQKISSFSSDCGKKKQAITCRRKRSSSHYKRNSIRKYRYT